ncbi:MAG: hypothetical protein ACKPEN_17445 [Planktothrix sp.]|uniref:hypothetical protein n=2 Tax=Planktothrix sp. TaxID=3088171 RepID=UPI0038D44405
MSIETKSAPTKAQMQAAIAQTLALPFAYNAPVEVLDFKVDDTGKISGRFKDSARPRVFDFELDGNTVNFKPYAPGRMDSGDTVEQWEEFSSGYAFRFDAKVKTKGKAGDAKKPQCVKPTAYNCGKACINIKNNCKSNPDDAKSKDRLEKLKAAGIDYTKETKKSTPKSTAKTKKEAKKTPEIDKNAKVTKEISPSEKGKESDIEEGKKATETDVKSEDRTETSKQPDEKPKNLNLVGNGDHESMPSTAEEYHKALEKAGVNISEKEAKATVESIYKWTKDSTDIRADQKAGEENDHADRISNYVRNSTPYKGEVYRGIHFGTKKEALNWAKGDKDGVLDNQGAHASWSSSLETAEEFSDDFFIEEKRFPVVIKTINKSGASIKNLSNIRGEDEVIVLKDTRHRVKSVKEENGRIIVEAEEI